MNHNTAMSMVVVLLLSIPSASIAEEETEELSKSVARYFCAYKQNYFILGVAERDRTNPTTKFQFSFQTMLFDLSKPDEAFSDSCAKPSGNHLIHLGFTQKSIWNLYGESAPFEESNYNPEIFYGYHVRRFGVGWATFGIEHESNGEGGTDSRGWNRLYGRARWNFDISGMNALSEQPDDRKHWYAAFEAKLWWPFDKDDDQVDLAKRIGYGRLRGVLNSREYSIGSFGFDVEVTKGGHPGEFDYASVQLGASWRPTMRHRLKFVPFFYVQYFEGYGETLIRADEHTRAFRGGIRLVL